MIKFVSAIVFDAVANPLLYLVSVGIGIGALVDQNLGESGLGGVSYLTFVAPALLATTAITGAMDEVVFPCMDGFKWQKTFYAMNSTPLTPRQIASGVFFSAMTRTIFAVTCYWDTALSLRRARFTAIMARDSNSDFGRGWSLAH